MLLGLLASLVSDVNLIGSDRVRVTSCGYKVLFDYCFIESETNR